MKKIKTLWKWLLLGGGELLELWPDAQDTLNQCSILAKIRRSNIGFQMIVVPSWASSSLSIPFPSQTVMTMVEGTSRGVPHYFHVV